MKMELLLLLQILVLISNTRGQSIIEALDDLDTYETISNEIYSDEIEESETEGTAEDGNQITTSAPDFTETDSNDIPTVYTEAYTTENPHTSTENTDADFISPTPNPDIGLEPFTVTDHPYFILLEYNNRIQCFGVLIKDSWAITAATCTLGRSVSKMKVRASFTSRADGQVRHLRAKYEHPEFDAYTNNYNIVLLRLHAPVTTYTFRKIRYSADPPLPGATGVTAVVEHEANCRDTYCPSIRYHEELLENLSGYTFGVDNNCTGVGAETEFCVSAEHTSNKVQFCDEGLYGSPLIIQGKLYGIFSSDYHCSTSSALFTTISSVAEFIKKVTHIPPSSRRHLMFLK